MRKGSCLPPNYANKTKESITSQELGSRDFWRIANSVLKKGKSAIPPLLNFLIFSIVLGLLDQLQIFSQLIKLLGLLTGLELLEQWHLIYPRLLTGFGMLVYFTNLGLMEFQVRYLALFLPFSVIDSSKWFWVESLHKNIHSWSYTFPAIH